MNRQARWQSPSFWITLSKNAGLLVAAIGVAVLIGWDWDIEQLKSLNPNWISMKANAALSFIGLGLALYLKSGTSKQRVGISLTGSHVLASIVILIAAITLIEYLSGSDLGIDQWLFHDSNSDIRTLSPGRMAPGTSILFILAGTALLWYQPERRRAAARHTCR